MSNKQNDDFRSYLNNYIKSKTIYVTAHDFLKAKKPLRPIWFILIISALLTIKVFGLGIMAAYLITYLFCLFQVLKRNLKQYPVTRETISQINMDDLASFLSENMEHFPYSGWSVGNPAVLGVAYSNLDVIEVTFKNKTYHRIVFVDGDVPFYRIGTHRTTALVGNNYYTIYKNSCLATPILEAAVEYYLKTQATEGEPT